VEAEQLPENAGYRVQFRDLRFASVESYSRRNLPLTGYVELDPRLNVVDQYMGSPPERR